MCMLLNKYDFCVVISWYTYTLWTIWFQKGSESSADQLCVILFIYTIYPSKHTQLIQILGTLLRHTLYLSRELEHSFIYGTNRKAKVHIIFCVKINKYKVQRAYSRTQINSQLSSSGVKVCVLEISDFRVRGLVSNSSFELTLQKFISQNILADLLRNVFNLLLFLLIMF